MEKSSVHDKCDVLSREANTAKHISVVWSPIAWKQCEKKGLPKKSMEPLNIHANPPQHPMYHNTVEHLTPSQDLFSFPTSAMINNAQFQQCSVVELSSSKRSDDISQSLFHCEPVGNQVTNIQEKVILRPKETSCQSLLCSSESKPARYDSVRIVNNANALVNTNVGNCLDLTQLDYSLTYPAVLEEADKDEDSQDANTQIPGSLDCRITQPNFKLTYPSFLAEMDSDDLMSRHNQHSAAINSTSVVNENDTSDIDCQRKESIDDVSMKDINTTKVLYMNFDEDPNEDNDLVPDLEIKIQRFPLESIDDNIVPVDYCCNNIDRSEGNTKTDDHVTVPSLKPSCVPKHQLTLKEEMLREEHSQSALVPSVSTASYLIHEPKTGGKQIQDAKEISITQIETNIIKFIGSLDKAEASLRTSEKLGNASNVSIDMHNNLRKEDDGFADKRSDHSKQDSEDPSKIEVTSTGCDNKLMKQADKVDIGTPFTGLNLDVYQENQDVSNKVLSPDSQLYDNVNLLQDEKIKGSSVACQEKVVPETQINENHHDSTKRTPTKYKNSCYDEPVMEVTDKTSRKTYETQDYVPGQYGCGLIDSTTDNSNVDSVVNLQLCDESNIEFHKLSETKAFYRNDVCVEPIYPEQCVPNNKSINKGTITSQDDDSDYSEAEDTQVNVYPSEMLNFDQSFFKRKPMPQLSFHYERVVPDPVEYTCTRKRRVGLSRRYCVSTALHQEVGAAKRHRMQQEQPLRMHVDNAEYY